MQITILQFFQNIAGPILDQLAELTTMLGEELVYILIIAVFFWAISKRRGFIMASTLLVSLFVNTFLKLIFHTPRPFEVLSDLEGKRLETATGYSFPSGHTQGATSFYTALIYLFRNRLLRILCVLAIFLVGISRLYLGVHWPVDVLGGWLFGILITLYMAGRVDRLWDNPSGLRRFLLIFMACTVLITLGMTALEILSFRGSMKIDDFFKAAGMVIGCFGGFILESKHIRFDPPSGSRSRKILRVILGLAVLALIQGGLKQILPDYFLSHLFRYGAMGFWITCLFPYLGVRTGLFQTVDSE